MGFRRIFLTCVSFLYVHRCRKDGQPIPQMVIGRPLWGSSLGVPFSSIEVPDAMAEGRLNRIPIKAKLDGKYDGQQTQLFSLSLQVISNDNASLQMETLYKVPVSFQ